VAAASRLLATGLSEANALGLTGTLMTNDPLPPLRWTLESKREATSARLQDAFVAGYLQEDELDLRLDRVHTAQDVEALRAILHGLPERFLDGVHDEPPITSHALAFRDPVAPAQEDGALVRVSERPRYLVRLIGDAKRTMVLGEFRTLRCLSIIGDTRIRLRADDAVPGGVTHIRIFSTIGDIRIEVPPGVRVLNECLSLIGDVSDPAADDPQAVHTVILRGLSFIGDVNIRVRES